MLEGAARDFHDPRRGLHPRLHLLQRRDRPPRPLDPHEPERVGQAVAKLGLNHIVVTSVDRDDLDDGGAGHFARTIAAIRAAAPATTIEVLVPDFLRKEGAIETVVAARPDVLNHNLETVPRLYAEVRPGARYFASLRLLDQAKRLDPEGFTKSGIMVGLGEDRAEVLQVMDDLRAAAGRFPDDRAVPAADPEASPDRPLRDPGGVRVVSPAGARQGVPDGLGLAADALVLPCRRRFRPPQGGPGRRGGTGLMRDRHYNSSFPRKREFGASDGRLPLDPRFRGGDGYAAV